MIFQNLFTPPLLGFSWQYYDNMLYLEYPKDYIVNILNILKIMRFPKT